MGKTSTVVPHLVLVLVLIASACLGKETLPAVKDGDIIFHTSRSAQSVAVQRATGSPYSHMGLIVHRDGVPFVFEAIATVRPTPLEQWIARGTDGHFVVKRLRDADSVLTSSALVRLREEAQKFAGRPYDLTFEWADDRIYCSELVWKAYDRALGIQIGALQKIREFNLTDPAVRAKMQERYGNNIPLDEPVISPAAMFQSPLLVTVAEE
ncbi:MAG: YiiX family permuted papain-like enzyme [Candidatus Sumerlaeaceae bacterium]|nr:YiiX family permuted papain-like enzyme [Candidatus Sumerlaeaceae bacterium]